MSLVKQPYFVNEAIGIMTGQEICEDAWLHIPRRLVAEIGLVPAMLFARIRDLTESCAEELVWHEEAEWVLFTRNFAEADFPFFEVEEVLSAFNKLQQLGIIEARPYSDEGRIAAPTANLQSFRFLESQIVCRAADGTTYPQPEPEKPKVSKSGHVYLMKSGAHFKIGKAKNADNRLKAISPKLPLECRLIHKIQTSDALKLESYWHRHFKHKRGLGEWFDLNTDDIAEFCAQSEMEVTA